MSDRTESGCRSARRTTKGPTPRSGYTLVEVIIVALLLAVLMSGVWSMFQMQNRMILQGQRLSRESSSVRTAWSRLQNDLDRICLPEVDAKNPTATKVATTPASPISESESELGDPYSRRETDLKPISFLFEGGNDWFIFDTYRPWQQFPAIIPLAGSDSNSPGFGSMGTANSNPYSALAADKAQPMDQETPYQRVCYAWVTSEELQQWLNVEIQAKDLEESDDAVAQSDTQVQTLDQDAPKRWFLRITCDQSVGSPDDQQASANDQVSSTETDDQEANLSLSDAQKQNWLQWILKSDADEYLKFQRWIGTVASVDTSTNFNSLDTDGTEHSISWTSNAGQIQIDWLPTVIDGQFRYLVDDSWHDKVDSQLRWDRKGLQAVELQYDVDPHHIPARIEADEATTLAADSSLSDLDSFETLSEEVTTWDQAIGDPSVLDELPEHNYVCLVPITQTFHNSGIFQTSVRSPSSDSSIDPNGLDVKQSEEQ